MAYTFLKAEGFTVGKSLVENDQLKTAAIVIVGGGDSVAASQKPASPIASHTFQPVAAPRWNF